MNLGLAQQLGLTEMRFSQKIKTLPRSRNPVNNASHFSSYPPLPALAHPLLPPTETYILRQPQL